MFVNSDYRVALTGESEDGRPVAVSAIDGGYDPGNERRPSTNEHRTRPRCQTDPVDGERLQRLLPSRHTPITPPVRRHRSQSSVHR